MPELPEVQTVVDDLIRAGVLGSKITDAEVRWHKSVLPLSPEEFRESVSGREILRVGRRAKYIRIDLSGAGTLLIHLRMTGRMDVVDGETEIDPHHRVIIRMGDRRELRLHDTRKFARFVFTTEPRKILGKLGPEPLDPPFDAESFHARLQKRSRIIKPLLLDQTFIAGLGNIYVDESLWSARIHPLRIGSSLSEAESAELIRSIRQVLKTALGNRGTSLGDGEGNYSSAYGRGRNKETLNVFRRQGEACPRCGGTIERLVVGQRGTHICPKCQPLPEDERNIRS